MGGISSAALESRIVLWLIADQHSGRPRHVGNNKDQTDIVEAIQGLLNYYVNANRPLRDDQERKVVRFAARVLRELEGGTRNRRSGLPPRAQTASMR